MDPITPYRPRVSRETRQLLTAGVLALAALWLLARVTREVPLSSGPVPAVLGRLAPVFGYDDLAGEIARLQTRIGPALVAYPLTPSSQSLTAPGRLFALRMRDGLAVAALPAGLESGTVDPSRVLAYDSASRLVVLRVNGVSGPLPVPWISRQAQWPRHLIVSDPQSSRVALRPVFVSSLDPVESPAWPGQVWAVPANDQLEPGAFVFTNDAELVGLVSGTGSDTVVVPAVTVLAEAERLLREPSVPPGTLGVAVQTLTPVLASATGAPAGVVVAWVDASGPARGRVAVGDVIETADGQIVRDARYWEVRLGRLRADQLVTLGVRRGGKLQTVTVSAAAVAPAPVRASERRPLGLTLRARAGTGSEVVRVEPGSASERAGVQAGDLITLVGDAQAPTPGDIREAFAVLREGQSLLVALARGESHQVTALQP